MLVNKAIFLLRTYGPQFQQCEKLSYYCLDGFHVCVRGCFASKSHNDFYIFLETSSVTAYPFNGVHNRQNISHFYGCL